MLYKKSELKKALFLEIAMQPIIGYDELPSGAKKAWTKSYHPRYESKLENPTPKDTYNEYAQLHAEFSKIVCVSVGVFEEDAITRNIISLTGKEKDILNSLADLSTELIDNAPAGFNITGYTIPAIMKRYLINKIDVPFMFANRGKKPWDVVAYDLAKDFSSTGYDYTSFAAMCYAFKEPITEYIRTNGEDEKKITENCEQIINSILNIALQLCK